MASKSILNLVRKYLIITDTVVNTPKEITRAAGVVIFKDPLPSKDGKKIEDLSPLYDVGSELGDVLMKKLVPLFPNKDEILVQCYDWSDEMTDKNGWRDHMRTSIVSKNFRRFLDKE